MTRAISIRLDEELLAFIRNDLGTPVTSEGIRGVLLWLKQYQAHYLSSVREYIQSCMTDNSERLSEKS